MTLAAPPPMTEEDRAALADLALGLDRLRADFDAVSRPPPEEARQRVTLPRPRRPRGILWPS